MVKFFLNHAATKVPIKKSDINKCLKIHFKLFPEIFASCVETLKNVYGLEVLEIDEKSGKMFLIYSSLAQGVSAEQLSPDQRNDASLLFLILTYIFMKGGDVQEAHLLQFLDQLNIDTNEPHKIFGDIAKLVREKFARQLYLKRDKTEIEGVKDLQIHLSWGTRAEKEFDKKELLKAVAGAMNKTPANFVNQYYIATQAEADDAIEIL